MNAACEIDHGSDLELGQILTRGWQMQVDSLQLGHGQRAFSGVATLNIAVPVIA
jgi:hypothetical protein